MQTEIVPKTILAETVISNAYEDHKRQNVSRFTHSICPYCACEYVLVLKTEPRREILCQNCGKISKKGLSV